MKYEKAKSAWARREGGMLALVVFFAAALRAPAQEPETLSTDFTTLDASAWICKGKDVQVRDGKLVIHPRAGHQYRSTREKFLNATLEVSVRFHALSRDGTAFY